ncbi:hypothetical protein QBA38_24715 [Streptomyces stelliscabiei]|uniref:hypothetical protein n=1 Tax=Streptomyces TaxID=1883 RepID=UPI000BD77299|nr:hypothetical protein [Streptomyces sp. 1222.2]SOD77350.1 hypothetical protein SAMN06272781_5225 [Streptomyces sp. 1222.2]
MPQRPCSAPRVCSNRDLSAAKTLGGGHPRTATADFPACHGTAVRCNREGADV